ncbi:probable G-protein coupled receptor Mth-like 5 isoform X1 [Leptopilina boulardi]|uniref:probable G-protein coupled receptor Mth-like 5 isoform X1 n=1 Tax=Leptopilina boulardi TaxID=63433 RepID=UPI0021F570FA|nr:probable G-protein coupled receptor Mth-like 5 isoform X1 [Leptopilina boulardi]
MYLLMIIFFIFLEIGVNFCFAIETNNDYTPQRNLNFSILIGKCCELNELLKDDKCIPLNETKETQVWRPTESIFDSENHFERNNKQPKGKLGNYKLKIGLPRCQNGEHQWHVYHSQTGSDKLYILPSGMLRHYVIKSNDDDDEVKKDEDFYFDDDALSKNIHYDYPFGHYCADKAILSRDGIVTTYAMVCVPELTSKWTETDQLIRYIVDPIFHAIAIISYFIVAIIYFVLPQLRNLVGNSISSMCLCLIISQCVSTIRIFKQFGNHINFLIIDIILYVSLLGAYFWLTAFGYYIWKTFRSRNVYLRVTDARTYCYYSTFVWSATISIAFIVIFSHFTLETNKPIISGVNYSPQETIGWLGLSFLFMCIGFSIIINFCFVLTTANTIKKMSTYSRIQHKMKYGFRMFVLLFIIMSVSWISILFSQLEYNALIYCDIFINLLQGILILYACVFGQKRVTFLLGKTCNCCMWTENVEGIDWGEEMIAINLGY